MKDVTSVEELFARLAGKVSQAAGSFWTFALALLVVLVWAATGPVFGYSETWQLVVNTGTTIVTFLMVFVIQHAQNKDMRAVQLKLNELIAAVEGASNRLIDVEDLSDRELEHLYARYQHLARTAATVSHGAKLSIEDEPDNERAVPHAESEAEKKPVKSNPESKNHRR
ncbi:MAG TPA: low affinity iron permease family protein [Polyangiaceae bacterium]|nr:low affinity iron permease family protein [Polyangiaceae bacterium]